MIRMIFLGTRHLEALLSSLFLVTRKLSLQLWFPKCRVLLKLRETRPCSTSCSITSPLHPKDTRVQTAAVFHSQSTWLFLIPFLLSLQIWAIAVVIFIMHFEWMPGYSPLTSKKDTLNNNKKSVEKLVRRHPMIFFCLFQFCSLFFKKYNYFP